MEYFNFYWNILISKDKNFSNTSYKNLKRETPSMDIFKEVTFKHNNKHNTTNIIFRRKDFSIFRGLLVFFNVVYIFIK